MSNTTYTPNKWILLEISGRGEKIQKVLAGWSGGYLDDDSWRLCSGVARVEEEGDYYMFHNHSGSIYKCHKKGQGVTALSGSILKNIKDIAGTDDDVTVEEIKMEE